MGLDKDLTNTRMYTAFLHIIITACIYWTRRDNVMVAQLPHTSEMLDILYLRGQSYHTL